mmetsp:Transcript_11536/g.31133  ORF Transcript_11536/g.31133 Transcript_11536/m.31133 type:complete len:270 (-) Transcript_11536:18-827(-)
MELDGECVIRLALKTFAMPTVKPWVWEMARPPPWSSAWLPEMVLPSTVPPPPPIIATAAPVPATLPCIVLPVMTMPGHLSTAMPPPTAAARLPVTEEAVRLTRGELITTIPPPYSSALLVWMVILVRDTSDESRITMAPPEGPMSHVASAWPFCSLSCLMMTFCTLRSSSTRMEEEPSSTESPCARPWTVTVWRLASRMGFLRTNVPAWKVSLSPELTRARAASSSAVERMLKFFPSTDAGMEVATTARRRSGRADTISASSVASGAEC